MPLRFHFAAELSFQGLFRLNTCGLVGAMRLEKEVSPAFMNRYVITFSLVQTVFLETAQPSKLLKMVASISGAFFSGLLGHSTQNAPIFSFLNFVCCLIYDRTALASDTTALLTMAIMTELVAGPIRRTDIEELAGPKALKNSQFVAHLAAFAHATVDPFGTTYTIVCTDGWHPFAPFARLETSQRATVKFCEGNDGLLRFPPLPPGLEGLLLSPVLFAVEFFVLTRGEVHMPSAHLIFGLLIAAAGLVEEGSGEQASEEKSIVEVDSLPCGGSSERRSNSDPTDQYRFLSRS
jgi:hypothetical protein